LPVIFVVKCNHYPLDVIIVVTYFAMTTDYQRIMNVLGCLIVHGKTLKNLKVDEKKVWWLECGVVTLIYIPLHMVTHGVD